MKGKIWNNASPSMPFDVRFRVEKGIVYISNFDGRGTGVCLRDAKVDISNSVVHIEGYESLYEQDGYYRYHRLMITDVKSDAHE